MNSEPSNVVKFYNGEQIPLELHKVRVVQKLHLVPDVYKRQGVDSPYVVVARVASAEQHPQADRLKVCQVDAVSYTHLLREG